MMTSVTLAERVSSAPARLWPGLVGIGINVAITVPLAALLNIWQDEAYTLHTTARGFAYAFDQAVGFEQNAPLYFVALTAWRHLGSSIFFLRLFSVLCVAASVALLPAIARRYLPRQNPLLLTLVVACNPFVVWAAVEMRVYAGIVLISALLLLTFYDAFVRQAPSKAAAAGYAVFVALALYTQYYLAFLVAAQGIAVAIYFRRSSLRFFLAGLAGAAAFVPMLVIVPGQMQNFRDGFASPSLVASFSGLAGILLRYVLPLPAAHAKLLYVAILLAVALALLAARPKWSGAGNLWALVTAICAAVLFAAGTFAFGVHVLDRHAASLYLPSTIAAFALFSCFRAPLERRAALAWSCLVLVLSLLALGRTYAGLAKPGDWIRVAAYIEGRETPNEPIVVFEAENALPFAYYYRGPNRVVPIPRAVDFRRFQATRFVIRNDADLEQSVPAGHRIWLVTAGQCASSNIQFGCDRLERFVARRYRAVLTATFQGAQVRLLER